MSKELDVLHFETWRKLLTRSWFVRPIIGQFNFDVESLITISIQNRRVWKFLFCDDYMRFEIIAWIGRNVVETGARRVSNEWISLGKWNRNCCGIRCRDVATWNLFTSKISWCGDPRTMTQIEKCKFQFRYIETREIRNRPVVINIPRLLARLDEASRLRHPVAYLAHRTNYYVTWLRKRSYSAAVRNFTETATSQPFHARCGGEERRKREKNDEDDRKEDQE